MKYRLMGIMVGEEIVGSKFFEAIKYIKKSKKLFIYDRFFTSFTSFILKYFLKLQMNRVEILIKLFF